MAPRQPPLSPRRPPLARAAPSLVRRLVWGPLYEEDKISFVDILDKATYVEAGSKLLDGVAKFCGLERPGTEDTTKVIGMMNPPYHAPVRAPINLTLTWHNSTIEVADHNHNIIMGKSLKKLNLTKP